MKPHLSPIESSIFAAEADEVVRYVGPERRASGAGLWRLMAAVLDEVDYGLMLVADGGRIIHANHFARQALGAGALLEIHSGRIRAADPKVQAQLLDAVLAAQQRDARVMLNLGLPGQPSIGLSVVPLPLRVEKRSHSEHPVLITIQRQQLVEALSVGAFARAHNLSKREEEVLGCLCSGMKPAQIAKELGISDGTTRTHIHNLKTKAHCTSMVELVKRVAVLPPIVTALKSSPL